MLDTQYNANDSEMHITFRDEHSSLFAYKNIDADHINFLQIENLKTSLVVVTIDSASRLKTIVLKGRVKLVSTSPLYSVDTVYLEGSCVSGSPAYINSFSFPSITSLLVTDYAFSQGDYLPPTLVHFKATYSTGVEYPLARFNNQALKTLVVQHSLLETFVPFDGLEVMYLESTLYDLKCLSHYIPDTLRVVVATGTREVAAPVRLHQHHLDYFETDIVSILDPCLKSHDFSDIPKLILFNAYAGTKITYSGLSKRQIMELEIRPRAYTMISGRTIRIDPAATTVLLEPYCEHRHAIDTQLRSELNWFEEVSWSTSLGILIKKTVDETISYGTDNEVMEAWVEKMLSNSTSKTLTLKDYAKFLEIVADMEDANFRQAAIPILRENTDDCIDRTIETLNMLFAVWKMWQIEMSKRPVQMREKVRLLIGIKKSELIDEYVRRTIATETNEQIKRAAEKEQVEITLYLKNTLEDELGLVLFSSKIQFTTEAERHVEQLNILSSDVAKWIDDHYRSAVVEWKPFQDVVDNDSEFGSERSARLASINGKLDCIESLNDPRLIDLGYEYSEELHRFYSDVLEKFI